MSVIQSGGVFASDSYTINQSLRFRASVSAYLSRTPAIAGNQKKFTLSFCLKRGAISDCYILGNLNSSALNGFGIQIAGDRLNIFDYTSAYNWQLTTSRLFRDPTGHYHIVFRYDSDNATASNRAILEINGEIITSFSTANYPALGFTSYWNNTSPHIIGRAGSYASGYLDGYMSEINFIDGQALASSAFGEIDSETGIWIPKKYIGAYGNNGFYLPFNDATTLTTLTQDRSGNGNNWTANNISLTAGATYDLMKDSPTNGINDVGNYATLNPLLKGSGVTLSSANMKSTHASTSGWTTAPITFLPKTGKYYGEFVLSTSGGSDKNGVCLIKNGLANVIGSFGTGANSSYWYSYYGHTASFYNNSVSSGSAATYTTGDIIQIAIDCDNGKVYFGKNNVWQNSGDPVNGVGYAYSGLTDILIGVEGYYGTTWDINFGQRPFAYTPPAGFKALCTSNMPTPTIKKGSDHFNIKLDTGANIKTSSEALYASFLEWIKDRANANSNQLIDTVRGTSAVLQSDTTNAETTYTAPTGSSVGWVWKGGGNAVTNTAGTITSQVSANTVAGFSILTRTGTGANGTIGHGLGVAPAFRIVKDRTAASANNWAVWHKDIANTEYLLLNSSAAKATGATYWNSTSPTSTLVSVGTANDTNQLNHTYVEYCFAEIEGFSKFGSIVGNASADGVFAYCNFAPKFILFKNSSAVSNWIMFDSVRNTYNVLGEELYPNLTTAGTNATDIDILSNGFKIRTTASALNGSGNTIIFAAFAENPFQTNPRAR